MTSAGGGRKKQDRPRCGGKSGKMTEQTQNPDGSVPEGISLGEMFGELDQIMEKMESPEVSLEDAFALYERGMKMIRQCSQKLDLVEKRMMVIAQNGEEVPFDAQE